MTTLPTDSAEAAVFPATDSPAAASAGAPNPAAGSAIRRWLTALPEENRTALLDTIRTDLPQLFGAAYLRERAPHADEAFIERLDARHLLNAAHEGDAVGQAAVDALLTAILSELVLGSSSAAATAAVGGAVGAGPAAAPAPITREQVDQLFLAAERQLLRWYRSRLNAEQLVCLANTGSGTPCRNQALPDSLFCRHHDPGASPDAPPERLAVPSQLPQRTFLEAKAIAAAIGDGPTKEGQQRWQPIEGEVALRHMVPGASHQTKFSPTPNLVQMLEWLGQDVTLTSLRYHLERLSFDAVILFGVCVSLAVDRGRFRAPLDDLIDAIGWKPRSRADRAEKRRTVWQWLMLFDSFFVIGARPGRYRDRDTREYMDLTSVDRLLVITGIQAPVQPALGGTEPPTTVDVVAGPWIDPHIGDDRVLTYFGNVLLLAKKPRGQVTQRLAVAIGMALNQGWRERAAKAVVKRGAGAGPDKLTVQIAPFTRRELLTTFGTDAARDVEEALEGNDPGRAVKYWDDAIKELRMWGVVGSYLPLDPMPTQRQGWQDFWYQEQRLDIRPSPEGCQAIAQIQQARRRADRARRTTRRT
jgi:hypothetical protein